MTVTYLRGDRHTGVTGAACVLACWHHVIPYICPELPEAQLTALRYAKKVPLVYTNVFVKQWTASSGQGQQHRVAGDVARVDQSRLPGEHRQVRPFQVAGRTGGAAHDQGGVQTRAAGPAQHVAGRAELLQTSFETIERGIRDQLGRMLAGGGFDPAGDILGITVNRWPHGYAYQYSSLWDPFWLEGGEQPCAVARRPHGRIAIANSDAGAYAYTDSAIDHAHRAVQELTAKTT